MEEQKQKRVFNAFVVGAVLFFVILLSVLIFLFVKIGIERKEIAELKQKIYDYQKLTKEERELAENMDTFAWIEQRARELGLELVGDIDPSLIKG